MVSDFYAAASHGRDLGHPVAVGRSCLVCTSHQKRGAEARANVICFHPSHDLLCHDLRKPDPRGVLADRPCRLLDLDDLDLSGR
jgi:hypothetical protein